MRFKLVTALQVARTQVPAGTIVDSNSETAEQMRGAGIDSAEIERLINVGAIQVVDENAVVERESAAPSELEQMFVHFNAPDAKHFIGLVRDPAILNKLAKIENARPSGPRKSVTDAIVARATLLDVPVSQPTKVDDDPETKVDEQ